MAEVTGLRHNALPYPVYGAPWGVTFPILDADGDLVTGAASLDSEVSKNGDTFADCTNEATEVATSSGVYYLLLTATEMTADVVTVIVKTSTSGAKTTTLTLYPRKLVPLRTGTAAGGATGYITLDSSAGALDDLWNGCLCVAVIDSGTEARVIDDYTGSNQQAAVTPDWNTAPDSDDTFTVYLPEGRQIPTVNLTAINGTVAGTSTAQLGVNAVQAGGTAWGSGAITAGSIASDALTAAKLAADVGSEIADAVCDEILSGHTTSGSLGKTLLDMPGTLSGIQGSTDGLYSNPMALATNALSSSTLDASAVTEIVDAVWAKAMSDLSSIPGATASVLAAINLIFMEVRNKLTQTADTSTLFKDDSTTVVGTSTLSDAAGTFTRGKWG